MGVAYGTAWNHLQLTIVVNVQVTYLQKVKKGFKRNVTRAF